MPEQTLTLLSPHSKEECYRRLVESVDSSFFAYFSKKAVAGRVSLSSFQIRKLIRFRNSFQIFLTASLTPVPEGTLITGRFGMHVLVKVFLAVWFGMVVLVGGVIGGASLVSYLIGGSFLKGNSWLALFIIPFMILVGTVLVVFGRHFAHDESLFLKNFLIDLLDAREMASPRVDL